MTKINIIYIYIYIYIYTILIFRSTYIFFCHYRPVAAAHFGPSSSEGLGAILLSTLFYIAKK